MERVISDTGDKGLAIASVDAIARARQAWGIRGPDAGLLASQIRSYGVDVQTGLDIIGAIGARGSVPGDALATVAGRLYGAVGGLGGRGGAQGFAELTAMIKAVATITGGAEGVAEAVTAMSSAFSGETGRSDARPLVCRYS